MTEISNNSSNGWGICPFCFKERRTEEDKVVSHRRFDYRVGKMIPCQGSGETCERQTRAPRGSERGRHVVKIGASRAGAGA